jgi:hypothetical protein
MKRHQPIFSPLLGLMLAALMLLTLPVKGGFVSKKAEKEQSSPKKQKPETVHIKAACPEAVVPFVSIHFSAADYIPFFLPFPDQVLTLEKQVFSLPFRLPWLENTFCHHIAINAP